MDLIKTASNYWDGFTTWAMHFGMPLVQGYHLICSCAFLNVASEDSMGLEKLGDQLLMPTRYLLAGNIASDCDPIHGVYQLKQEFNYEDGWLWPKTAVSTALLPLSLTLGSLVKGLSFVLTEGASKRHEWVVASQTGLGPGENHLAYYQAQGIVMSSLEDTKWIEAPKHERRPGDEQAMKVDKEALREIVTHLNDSNIPFWLDCGTCLGAYRYGGIIPWDHDIDIGVLQKDHDNIKKALSKLDPKKYALQDWSSRDKPKTYLKVYVKETGGLIDIYHFAINEKSHTISSVLSNENSVFLSNGWKTRERRFVIPTPVEWVFPLKKTNFDGIVAFVPNEVELYLKQRYGEDIGPAKVFCSETNRYEKDVNHPYWKQPFAH